MINLDLFFSHRVALLDKMQDNSIAIIPAADYKGRNRDVEYPYRQDSDFFYLSGFIEDNACLVIRKQKTDTLTTIFCQPKNKSMEIWTGIRLGPDAAVDHLKMDQAFAIDELEKKLPELMADCDAVYGLWGARKDWDEKLIQSIERVKQKARTGVTAPTAMLALEPLLHDMRLIKSEAEIEIMTKAAEISAQAHIKAMTVVTPGMNEYQLEGEIQYYFSQQGCRFVAYPSIVGSGDNACILHYTDNNQMIVDGDLILIDAGCELDYYASDITRTFPANGRFSEPQKALYELVLSAQLAAIECIKPGNNFNQAHEAAIAIITKGLIHLGLLGGELNELIEKEAYKLFFMHKTGHWLGLDVHDVGAYKENGEWRTLQPGMVLTVEPGLYVAPDEETVDPKWRGIGIRIEDDVLVTATGCRVLSSSVPKSVEDIESLMIKR